MHSYPVAVVDACIGYLFPFGESTPTLPTPWARRARLYDPYCLRPPQQHTPQLTQEIEESTQQDWNGREGDLGTEGYGNASEASIAFAIGEQNEYGSHAVLIGCLRKDLAD